METCSSILAWEIPWTEEPGGLQSMGLYDLNQIHYDYTVEVRNRFKGLDLIDRVPDELWNEVRDATPWTVARQAPLSMGFPRAEYGSGLPVPSPGDLPNPEIKPASPALHTFSNFSLNLAIRSSWSEPQSAPRLVLADSIELLHL